jgi:hypothetical protein
MPPPDDAPVRFRPACALLTGAACVAALTALSLFSNLRYGRYITASSLPSGAMFFFVLVLCVSAALGRLRRAWGLTPAELALVFGMLLISAALPQASVAETLVTLCASPAYFPKSGPSAGAYGGEQAPWLLVRDAEAVRRFYEGDGPSFTGWRAVPWAAWAAPLAGWSAFALLFLLAVYCLARVFAHRWAREERVSFPLMELPLELLGALPRGSGEPPVWRNPLLYLGAAIPAAMITMGQFHKYYPWLPAWEQIMTYPVGAGWEASGPPLSALKDFTVTVWPLVIGVSYLLNAEVAVSIWAFHLLFWAQLYAYAALGYTAENSAENGGRGFSPLDWIHNMEFGAALALAGTLLAPLRGEIARAWRRLLGRREPDAPAPTVPPSALAGFVLANAGMLVWGWLAGASPLAVGGFLVLIYVLVVALGRVVAAGGLYLVDNGVDPQPLLYGLAGPASFTKGSHYVLTGQQAIFGRADMSLFYFASNEGRVAQEAGVERSRWHGAALAVSVLLALGLSYFLILVWSYRYGGVTFRAYPYSWKVGGDFARTAGFLGAAQRGPSAWTYGGVLVGALLGLLLAYLNRTFLWWRVAPFGFAMASSWNVANQIWSSVFFGWLIASLVRRYGGLKLYRALRPFFLGLILGDGVTVTAMALLEIVVGA